MNTYCCATRPNMQTLAKLSGWNAFNKSVASTITLATTRTRMDSSIHDDSISHGFFLIFFIFKFKFHIGRYYQFLYLIYKVYSHLKEIEVASSVILYYTVQYICSYQQFCKLNLVLAHIYHSIYYEGNNYKFSVVMNGENSNLIVIFCNSKESQEDFSHVTQQKIACYN